MDSISISIAYIISKWLITINQGLNIFSYSENLLLILVSIIVYAFTGNYKGITRYTGSNDIYRLLIRNVIVIILSWFLYLLVNIQISNYKFWILLWILTTLFIAFEKLILRDIISKVGSYSGKKNNNFVVIYGAGAAGAQLANSLRSSSIMQIAAFIDDDKHLWGRNINGIPIVPPKKISSLNKKVKTILLAIPSISRSKRKVLLEKLQVTGLKVLQVPTIEEISNGQAKIDSLRPIQIEDLLERDPVRANQKLLNKSVNNSCVCITGAGGSIGSELCKQIIILNPSTLILLEINEPSLYLIKNELSKYNLKNIRIRSILCNTMDTDFVRKVFNEEKVNIIFHAAAYKHVPLVEENPIQGISNNVFSTLSICEAALKSISVQKMILISSDKAVRPSNVMGASKRISELIVQSYAEISDENKSRIDKGIKKCFSMVRFGNVLGSSGSVVPLFYSQIKDSKPITLTHPEVTRYFMTITEASQLVLQTSAMAKGGEVFLLNMGQPVKIYDLAIKMIELSGLKVKSKKFHNGDVEIIYTGLRPGEKLYEELLIEPNSYPTAHPLIFKAIEKKIDKEKINLYLDELSNAIKNFDKNQLFIILSKLVPEWEKTDSFKTLKKSL